MAAGDDAKSLFSSGRRHYSTMALISTWNPLIIRFAVYSLPVEILSKPGYTMIRSYIILAWRNILRSKAYSFINIAGLSLGVTCCLLLALYIQDEMSYDKHHDRVNDLYILTTISPPSDHQ
jgi:hypothetical protein